LTKAKPAILFALRIQPAFIDDMKKKGEAVPLPVTSKQYSGKFIVRVPPELHRQLALDAAESGASLNRLSSARLSQ
jgi:predicted HicB family RNase H-like nuclease